VRFSKAASDAPCPLGGFTLVRSQPVRYYKIESPSELCATVVHPQIELKTSDARSVLKPFLSKARLWGNVGGLIAGLYTQDYDLIGMPFMMKS
jgi:homoserine kinase